MAGEWQPATDQTYRAAALVAVVALGGTAIMVGATHSATGQTDVQMDGLDVADTNQTIAGNVTDVELAANLAYQHDVPDATRRIVKLKVGPTRDDLELLAYQQTRDPAGQASGTVTLAGSLLDHPSYTAATFDPALANTTSKEVVVQAVIEVHRASGDVVTHTVTDTATLTLNDDATLTVELGGTGEFTVSTDE